jgi:hypothetical protein
MYLWRDIRQSQPRSENDRFRYTRQALQRLATPESEFSVVPQTLSTCFNRYLLAETNDAPVEFMAVFNTCVEKGT